MRKPFFSRPSLAASTALSGTAFRGVGAAAATEAERAALAADYQRRAANLAAGRAEDDDEDMSQAEKDRRARNRAAGRKEDDDGKDDDDEDDEGDDDEDGDDESDEEDMKKEKGKGKEKDGKKSTASIIRAARLRERARITHIIHSPGAAANVTGALQIALNTNLGRVIAADLVASLPPPPVAAAVPTLRDRMAEQDGRNAGRDAPRHANKAAAIDAAWDSAAEMHAITTRKA